MTRPPRVGLIGCGSWGRNLARNFAQLGALEAICDNDEVRVKEHISQFPGTRGFTDVDDLLGDQGVDAVAIASPPSLHHGHASGALDAGKDVFVEKPLALRYKDGVDLVACAAGRGAILMVGHILEYHPAVSILRQLVHEGELGEVWYVYSNRLNLGRVRREENILWSFAPHDISVICTLLDAEPEIVCASGGGYLQPEIADVTVTSLQFTSGARGHVFVSWLHPYKEQKLIVVGDRKMAVFDDIAREGKLKIYDKRIVWEADLPVARQTAETTLFFDETEPLLLECEHFLRCVAERRRPLTDGESALRVLRVLEASQRSIERGGVPVVTAEVF